MPIVMTVQYEGETEGGQWEEEFDPRTTRCLSKAPFDLGPEQYAQMIIDYFNSTLKPGEERRELVSVRDVA